jgi:hypothetical protein
VDCGSPVDTCTVFKCNLDGANNICLANVTIGVWTGCTGDGCACFHKSAGISYTDTTVYYE